MARYEIIENEFTLQDFYMSLDDDDFNIIHNTAVKSDYNNFLGGFNLNITHENYDKIIKDKGHYTFISFYQENGYVGTHANKDFFTVPNNWVRYGNDQNKYLITAKYEKTLNKIVDFITASMNDYFTKYAIIDNDLNEILHEIDDYTHPYAHDIINDHLKTLKDLHKKDLLKTFETLTSSDLEKLLKIKTALEE